MAHTQTSVASSLYQPLREAFQTSNQLFERLTESYQGLEGQVVALKSQLGSTALQPTPAVSTPYANDVILAMAGLAHQIRSPLMVAGVYAAQLRSCGEDQKEYVFERLNRNLLELENQLEELMQIAKGVQGSEQHFLLNEFVHGLSTDTQAWLRPSVGTIQWRNVLEHESSNCIAKRHALAGAIQNVLHNAVYSKKDVVCVECEFSRRQSGELLIRIADDGDGLSDAEMQNLFTPYASNRKGGHGLGLSFARHIAQAHGGALSLAYTSSQGSCFEFELPILGSPDSGADEHKESLGLEESIHAKP